MVGSGTPSSLVARLKILPRWQRWRKWALGTALGVGIYAILGFFVAPPIVRSQGEAALREITGRAARIGEVQIDPFALSLVVRDFELPDGDGSPFARFEELAVDFELSSLYHRAFTFAEIRIVAPFVHAKVRRDGTLNAADLLTSEPESSEADAPEAEAGPPPILVQLAKIERGHVILSDFSKSTPFEHEITPLDVELRDFGTRPDDESPFSLTATSGAGETLEWEGSGSVAPLYSSGQFALTGARLRTGWRFVQDEVFFEVVDGTVDVLGRYSFDARDGWKGALEGGEVRVRDFAVADRETGEIVARIPVFDVEGIAVSVPENTVHVDLVGSREGSYHLLRSEDGSFRAERLARTRSGDAGTDAAATSAAGGEEPVASATPAADPDAGPAWSVVVDRVELGGHRIEFEDRSTDPPVTLAIEVERVALRDVTTDPSRPIGLELALALGEEGRVGIQGPITTEPAAAELALEVADIDLTPLEPYWAPLVAIDLTSASAGLRGTLAVQAAPVDAPQLAFEGELRLDRLETLDARRSELVSWSALELAGIALTVEPTAFHLDRLSVRDPVAHVVIEPDGSVNLAMLVSEPAAGAPSSPSPAETTAAASAPVPISISLVEIADGEVTFEDRSATPNFSTVIAKLDGKIQGLSSEKNARAKVALTGEIDGATGVEIAGEVSPLADKTYLDMRLGLDNLELTPFTPYTGRFVGKAIARGKLFVDFEYRLENDVLVGENTLFLDQFTFGDPIESPDVVDLPVGLAVALLKDRKGEIHIDLPVRGATDDPDFNIARIVLDALGKFITQVATSPFAMVGELAGADGEAMSSITFAPGVAELGPDERRKLDALAKALAERPSLSLGVTGVATGWTDRPALQRVALEQALRNRRFQELDAAWFGEKPASVEEIELTPEDRREELARAFEEEFGTTPGAFFADLDKTAVSDGSEAPGAEETAAVQEEEMSRRLADTIEIADTVLRQLARERAVSIRDHLVEVGAIAAERVFVLDPDVDSGEPSASEMNGAGAAGATLALTAH